MREVKGSIGSLEDATIKKGTYRYQKRRYAGELNESKEHGCGDCVVCTVIDYVVL
jgi:hypothetical protein